MLRLMYVSAHYDAGKELGVMDRELDYPAWDPHGHMIRPGADGSYRQRHDRCWKGDTGAGVACGRP